MVLRKRKVSFYALRPIKVPRKVSFKTKDGRRISFTAKKTVRKRIKVNFYAKKRRGR